MNSGWANVIRVTGRCSHDREQEILSQTHMPIALERRSPGAVRGDLAKVRSQDFGAIRIVDCTATPTAGHRGPREISRTEGTWVAAQIYLGGRSVLTTTSTVIEPRLGSLLVWDSTAPSGFVIRETERKRSVFFPRDLVMGLCPSLSLRDPLHLEGSRPEVQVFVALVANLTRHAATLDEHAQEASWRALLELLAGCLRPHHHTGRAALHAGLFARACALIERRLGEPGLSPTTVAAGLRVSLRTLQDVFAERGETVSGHIKALRLGRCYAEVQRRNGRSITDIAFAHGFTNAGHFSRSFRERYGLSPRDVARTPA